ncbi:group 1 glycosyl transferase [Oleiphilus messinensis]|uniref:Group 1 glycosyl transferase n=1 Tax=Oleiphilus messinensis TaxID=141451 RepID=A0A1Y0I689_9GAMM|nr:glycosyltransferase family 4 protein [Oleiphilus messinensis]ARU56007.1 group 1 glycosyl transferase [Oleiphilus messinensis]
MNVLVLCKRYYTNKDLILDLFGRNFELPRALAARGHSVLVIALDYKGKRMVEREVDGVHLISLPLISFSVFGGGRKVFKAMKAFSPTHIIGSGDSHLGFIAVYTARMMRAFSVFDVYDHYLSFGSNRLPLMKRMFYTASRKSDLVLCASKNLEKFLRPYSNNICLIENGVDSLRFKPENQALCRRKLGLDVSAVIVGYFGSMEPMRGIEYLIEACQGLIGKHCRLKLLMAGKKSDQLSLSQSWIDYRGQVTQDEVVTMINACDVVAIPYLSNPLVDFGNSCKIGEYLACQVPIVTTSVDNLVVNFPEVLESLAEAVCRPGNTSELLKVIDWQLQTKRVAKCPPRIYWPWLGEKLESSLLRLNL